MKNSVDHWDRLIKQAHEEKKKHSFSAALFGSQPEPYLYQWLNKFKLDVKAKFYLYFYKELRGIASSQEKRKSLPIDYISR